MSTPALVPSFGSIGTILPPRPARASCRRAQWRSRMARLRATASAARSVLDGREHDGRLDRVGGLTPHRPGAKRAPTSSSKSVLMLTCRISPVVCAGSRRRGRGGARCARGGRGRHRRLSDRRSPRASDRRGVDWSQSSSGSHGERPFHDAIVKALAPHFHDLKFHL